MVIAVAALLGPLSIAGASTTSPSAGVGSSAGSAHLDATTSPCTGQPIKLMAIESVTGNSLADATVGYAIQAAQHAIKGDCVGGRPVQVTLCNDNSNSNQAAACGQQAVSGGYVAIVGEQSSAADSANAVTDAAGIPNFGNSGSAASELVGKASFPFADSLNILLGQVNIIAARGGKTMTLVAPDAANIQQYVGIVKNFAAAQGVTLTNSILVPETTTDFTPYAAQAKGTDGIVLLEADSQTQLLLNALMQDGVNFKKTIVALAGTTTNQTVAGFKGAINGAYISEVNVPTSSTGNPALASYLKNMKAIGQAKHADPGNQFEYEAVVLMAQDVLPHLKTVSAASITAYLQTASFAPGNISPVDFAKNPYTTSPLSALRLYSDQYMPVRVVNGVPVAAAKNFVLVTNAKNKLTH
jgi:branched-chain amino acid transport system substrate-binding protein